MKDYFGRDLNIGDKCFRLIHTIKGFRVEGVEVLAFTPKKVKVAAATFVNSDNLVRADFNDLNDEPISDFTHLNFIEFLEPNR